MGGDSMSDRIEAMDVRLRAVEGAIIDLASTTRMVRIIIAVMLAGLGLDVQEMI